MELAQCDVHYCHPRQDNAHLLIKAEGVVIEEDELHAERKG